MIAIIIPSLNPDDALPGYCKALRGITGSPILLVDDGSSADRRAIFEECVASVPGVELVSHDVNRGKGRALKTAFSHLLEKYPDIVGCVTADSDGQHAPEDVLRCIGELEKHPSALVLGARTFSQEDVPWKSRFGNNSMRRFFRMATGRDILDTQTGLRAIPADMMRELLSVKGERFEFESRMLLALHDRPLVQIPIRTIYENGNKGTHFNPFSDAAQITWIIIAHIVRSFGLFIAASLLSFGVDIGIFCLLFHCVFAEGMRARLAVSVVLARIVSAVFNYMVNRYVVFAESRKRHAFGTHAFAKYAALAVVLVTASYLLTKAGHGLLPRFEITEVKACVDLLLFIASFAIQRLVVFRPH